jgi:aldose 1-epimerase
MVEARVTQHEFGRLRSGEPVRAVTLTNRNGMRVGLISYGASIQSVSVPDRRGVMGEVAYGHPELRTYLECPQYAGATVGRVANRIAGARFELAGKTCRLVANDGANTLHGGPGGFDKANWRLEDIGEDEVTFAHTSRDGDQGFPATLEVAATYRLGDGNRLSVEYAATCDAATLVNLSNHAYWNLSGAGNGRSAMRHRLTIAADAYLPVTDDLIPTGQRRPVAGSPFDFRVPTVIGDRVREGSDDQLRPGRGFDHTWVLAAGPPGQNRAVAWLEDPWSGRAMVLDTDQRGLQFYSGNFFDGRVAGHGGQLARMGDFVALEPQAFPDTANQPDFGSIRLEPGGTYRNAIGWTFSTSQEHDR